MSAAKERLGFSQQAKCKAAVCQLRPGMDMNPYRYAIDQPGTFFNQYPQSGSDLSIGSFLYKRKCRLIFPQLTSHHYGRLELVVLLFVVCVWRYFQNASRNLSNVKT